MLFFWWCPPRICFVHVVTEFIFVCTFREVLFFFCEVTCRFLFVCNHNLSDLGAETSHGRHTSVTQEIHCFIWTPLLIKLKANPRVTSPEQYFDSRVPTWSRFKFYSLWFLFITTLDTTTSVRLTEWASYAIFPSISGLFRSLLPFQIPAMWLPWVERQNRYWEQSRSFNQINKSHR